jgi:hypothetical protein
LQKNIKTFLLAPETRPISNRAKTAQAEGYQIPHKAKESRGEEQKIDL